MELPGSKLLFATATAIATLALPAGAAAESVVPPENSAATQYTEAIPTGGGQQVAGKSRHGKNLSPSSVLGSGKAEKLDAQGPQGHAAAQFAAETAPNTVRATNKVAPAPPRSTPHGKSGSRNGAADNGAGPGPHPHATQTRRVSRQPRLDTTGGSSGLGVVLGQATGASSGGELGLLLPLVLATLVWALLYGLRRKQPRA